MSASLLSRAALPLVAVAAALLGAGATWLLNRGTAGDEIRTYLLKHPEVIPEAITELQRREAAKVIATSRNNIDGAPGTAWAGNPKGDVTVVEYLDYNCGYCRASLPAIDALIAGDPQVKVIYREWPVLSEDSVKAARYGVAVARIGGDYRKFHTALYAGGQLTEKTMDDAILASGVDPAAAKKAAATQGVEEALVGNSQLMRALGQTGTPSWIIGDRVYSGMQTIDQLKTAVAEARKAKTKTTS